MTDFLKKLIVSNKYSLLVILILSLWLRLARDFSIILSYIVLLVLYVAIGIGVSYVLDLIEVKKKNVDKDFDENKEYKSVSRSRTRSVPSNHEEISRHARGMNVQGSAQQKPTAKVTSAYVKSAGSMPSSMSRRLEKTAATFNSMKNDSDKFAEEERKYSSLYSKTQKSLFDNPEELYTNKKNKKEPVAEEKAVKVVEVKKVNEFEFDEYSATSEEEVKELVKEMDERISEAAPPKRHRIPPRTEISFEPESRSVRDRQASPYMRTTSQTAGASAQPVRPATQTPIATEQTTRPTAPNVRPTVQPEKKKENVSQRNTHVVRDDDGDKVSADMDKLDKLFNKSRDREDKSDSAPKTGFFSGLKKKESKEEIINDKRRTTTSVSPVPAKKSVRYVKPPVDLLRAAPAKNPDVYARAENEQNVRSKKLIDTLASFGVGAKITGVLRGPAVTRYELQPNPGVKVSKIVSLSDDIALNLAATGVRIEAPIPGKEAVGIEVPNKEIEVVYLHDVIASKEYKESQSKLTFAIGKDIAGKNIVSDIAKMPHLLIAGATGSGKSVCINTIIASILYKSGPDDVKMIMIDPKIVELGIYNGIPHLFVPVVTNPKKAAGALAWAVAEMERRYAAFSEHNVRDLKSYNEQVRTGVFMGEKMPQVVIIIDELADLMMVAAKEIEESIIRLAQKARAAGIHLIIATQRPSVDVITGLIKANIPSRIAFAVTSQVDSRTILDGGGAEKLLGRGDMLFHPIGMSKPLRVQGAFVSDGEIEALVENIKSTCGKVEYSQEIAASIEIEAAGKKSNGVGASSGGTDGGIEDEDSDESLIREAAELAFEFNQISTSFLQRKLRLGYSRASRIVDALEERGVVSAADGSKPRKVIISKEEWEASLN